MSTLLYSLGRAAFRAKGWVVVAWLLALAMFGGLAGAFAQDFDDSFNIPGTPSQEAFDQLSANFPQMGGSSATLIVVAPDGDTVDDRQIRSAIEAVRPELERIRPVESASDPYDDSIVTGMISDNRSAAVVNVQLDGDALSVTDQEKDALLTVASDLDRQLQQQLPGSQASMGGEVFGATMPGLSPIEALGVLVALIVLTFTLGSLAAAFLPLITAIIGVGISMALLLLSTTVTSIGSSTPMLAVMLGLAVGIDYALFILSRYRELLSHGIQPEEAAAQATATSGSAVVFAGLTVIIALVGLVVARIPFLSAMGLAAAGAVAVAVLIALTMLPALMGIMGQRMRPGYKKPKRSAAAAGAAEQGEAEQGEAEQDPDAAEPLDPTATREDADVLAREADGSPLVADTQVEPRQSRFFAGWARLVTRAPALTIIVVLIGTIALALPARDLNVAPPDASLDAPGSPTRVTYDLLAEHYGPGYNGPLIVTADIVTSDDPLGVMAGLKDDIERLPGVASVPLSTPNMTADTGIVQVVPTTGPQSEETAALVEELRAHEAQWRDRYGVSTAVTGFTAVAIDISNRLAGALLPFGIFVVGLSLILLTLVFRSIAVPIKATLGYLISVLGTFGAVTMVFEWGWGASLINLSQTGPVISFLPIIMMGILFGLAMDYEVFLVSRMREDYVHGTEARRAVQTGFVGSGRVVLAAALIMIAVFAFFVPHGTADIKAISFALAVGVTLDAFVVRMTLVPAVLTLLGDRAWWLPAWLERRLPSLDVEGESLHHQLRMANWPGPDHTELVYAEQIAASGSDRQVYGPLDVRLNPGEVAVAEGGRLARTGLLLTLAGRLKPDEGQARVAGYLLPEQARRLRHKVEVIDTSATQATSRLRRLITVPVETTPLVVVPDADLEAGPVRDALAGVIDDAEASGRTVVLGCSDSDDLADLLPPRHVRLRLEPGGRTVDGSAGTFGTHGNGTDGTDGADQIGSAHGSAIEDETGNHNQRGNGTSGTPGNLPDQPQDEMTRTR